MKKLIALTTVFSLFVCMQISAMNKKDITAHIQELRNIKDTVHTATAKSMSGYRKIIETKDFNDTVQAHWIQKQCNGYISTKPTKAQDIKKIMDIARKLAPRA